MEEQHDFIAKKNQYEKHFKKWKWTKNRTQEFWRQIAVVKRERELEGMASDFFDNGRKISEKQVERYTKRYINLGSTRRAPPCGLPLGITVSPQQSDPAQSMDSALPMDRALISAHVQLFTAELPFRIFENSFHPERAPLNRHSGAWSSVLDEPQTIDPRLLMQYGEFDPIRALPSEANEATSPRQTETVVAELKRSSNSGTCVVPDTILTALDLIMPPSSSETSSHDSLMKVNSEMFSSPLHRKILFSVSNNFAGIGAFPIAEVLRYLEKETSQDLYRYIFSSKGYSSGAIARNLFRAAIESGNSKIVDVLLSEKVADIDANTEVCNVQGQKYTLIERASVLRHEAVIRTLLDHKADVNKTFRAEKGRELRGALECAISVFGKYERLHPRIFQLLLNAGGKVNLDTMDSLVRRKDDEFFMAIVAKHACHSHDLWSKRGIFRDAIRMMDAETSIAMIKKLIEVGADLNHHVENSGLGGTYPRRLIDVAAQRGHLELVDILVLHGAVPTGDTLPCAVASGNPKLVQELLCMDLDVNSLGSLLITPLAAAIRSKSYEFRDLLIGKGALEHIREQQQFSSALRAACEVGDIQFTEYLVELGRDLGPKDLGIALMIVAKYGNEDAAKVLIDSGADLNTDSKSSLGDGPPLYEALKRRQIGLVRMLLDANANLHFSCHIPPMELAVRWGERSIIRSLIFAGSSLNGFRSEAPLTLAVKQKDLDLVELLLEAGADINNPEVQGCEGTALHAAAANGDIGMVRYLLIQGADPHDSAALQVAASNSNMELFELLLNAHTERYPLGRKSYGSAVLQKAIEVGDENVARMLVEKGADPNELLFDQRVSAFGHAIMKSQQNRVKFIDMCLQAKCDPNGIVASAGRSSAFTRETPSRITALLAAVGTRKTEIVEMLIRKGAEVNFPATGPVKRTPLQRAAEIGSLTMVRLLLSHGADTNAPPAERGGVTALQLAAIGGYIPIVRVLLDERADVNAPAAKVDGRTALEGVSEHGRLDMVAILLENGAVCKESDQGQLRRAMDLAKDNGHFSVSDFLERVASEVVVDVCELINLEAEEEEVSATEGLVL